MSARARTEGLSEARESKDVGRSVALCEVLACTVTHEGRVDVVGRAEGLEVGTRGSFADEDEFGGRSRGRKERDEVRVCRQKEHEVLLPRAVRLRGCESAKR